MKADSAKSLSLNFDLQPKFLYFFHEIILMSYIKQIVLLWRASLGYTASATYMYILDFFFCSIRFQSLCAAMSNKLSAWPSESVVLNYNFIFMNHGTVRFPIPQTIFHQSKPNQVWLDINRSVVIRTHKYIYIHHLWWVWYYILFFSESFCYLLNIAFELIQMFFCDLFVKYNTSLFNRTFTTVALLEPVLVYGRAWLDASHSILTPVEGNI